MDVVKAAESRLIQDADGWWSVQIRPQGSENNPWTTMMACAKRDSALEMLRDWWNGREVEWTTEENDDE